MYNSKDIFKVALDLTCEFSLFEVIVSEVDVIG